MLPIVALSVFRSAAVAVDFDRLLDVPDFERDVLARSAVRQKGDTSLTRWRKPDRLDAEGVLTKGQTWNDEAARCVGFRFGLDVGAFVHCGDGGAGDESSRRVLHSADQCAGNVLGQGAGKREKVHRKGAE